MMATATNVLEPVGRVGETLSGWLPRALTVLGVLVAGFVLAFVLRRVVRWLVRKTGLESVGERLGVSRVLYAVGARGSLAHLMGALVFFATLIVTFAIIAEMLELPVLASFAGAVASYLPLVLVAGLILVLGTLLADTVRNVIARGGRTEGEASARGSRAVMANAVYYGIIAVTVAIAVGQLGLDTSLVNALIAIFVAVTFLTAGLSLVLASREVGRNILASHWVRPLCRTGSTIQVGDIRGVVVKVTATSVLIRRGASLVAIPCTRVLSEPLFIDVEGEEEES